MADLALAPFGVFVIDVLRVRFQLRDLLVGDRKPELFFSFRQHDPEAPPRAKLEIG